MGLAFIGGTGLYRMEGMEPAGTETVTTRYGTVEVIHVRAGEKRAYFLPRHGGDHSVPPHRIPFRRNIAALKQLGVTGILASAAAGCLNPNLHPGDFVLLTDFLDFTKRRELTFFDEPDSPVIHLDMTTPYCPHLRQLLTRAAGEAGVSLHPQGVYVCTEGPRFETPAEVQMFKQGGADLVGMTNVPEVVLAREAEICYAAVAIATNYAAGISPHALTHTEVEEMMTARLQHLQTIFRRVLELYEDEPCACRQALDEYRRRLGWAELQIPV